MSWKWRLNHVELSVYWQWQIATFVCYCLFTEHFASSSILPPHMYSSHVLISGTKLLKLNVHRTARWMSTSLNYTDLSLSRDTASCATTWEIPSILRKPKVHYHIHNSPPLVPIVSLTNPVHTTPSYISKILLLSAHLRLGLPSGLIPLYSRRNSCFLTSGLFANHTAVWNEIQHTIPALYSLLPQEEEMVFTRLQICFLLDRIYLPDNNAHDKSEF
jgi:hypothetical protein